MALNWTIAKYEGRIDYAASLHPEAMREFQRNRRGNQDYLTIAPGHGHKARIEIIEPETWRGGTSSLYACQVAIETLGFDRIVLCGVPMDERPHYYDSLLWKGFERYRHGWVRSLPRLKPHVRSMSGWTRGLLGAPDRDFTGQ